MVERREFPASEMVTVGPIRIEAVTRLSWGILHPYAADHHIVWLPKLNVLISDEDAKRGDEVEFNIPLWLVLREELAERPKRWGR